MLEIANTKVFGLEDSMARSGLPTRLGKPDIEELRYGGAKRARKLGKVRTGSGHDCYLKGIIVQFDVKYSGYITPQLQRYHWFDFVSSQSKMVRLKIAPLRESVNKYVDPAILARCEELQAEYQENPTYENRMRLLSNLPHGYEQWAGVTTSFLQLKTMYLQRKNHKLREDWGEFCRWCESLPRFRELVLGEYE